MDTKMIPSTGTELRTFTSAASHSSGLPSQPRLWPCAGGHEEVLDFSRHADVKTLMIYRDRERNVQGQLAALVAAGVAQ